MASCSSARCGKYLKNGGGGMQVEENEQTFLCVL